MEGSDSVGAWDYIFYVGGAFVAGVLAYLGKNKKEDKPATIATVSGALMDNRVVDPLVTSMNRLCDLMEREVEIRQSSVEETRRIEERKAMALAIADQVREDILAELRAEIQKTSPAPMPHVRKPRAE